MSPDRKTSPPWNQETVFISWFQGGEVFRSGLTYRRGAGNVFYFRPGHETYPTYHDPTAGDPQGVPGCRGACFAAVTATATEALSATIESAAAAHPDRVEVVDLRPVFAGHGAPNGLGTDRDELHHTRNRYEVAISIRSDLKNGLFIC